MCYIHMLYIYVIYICYILYMSNCPNGKSPWGTINWLSHDISIPSGWCFGWVVIEPIISPMFHQKKLRIK